ncbi:MAG: hypothetical protein V3V61_00320 [Gammaproteobacteria bacterium]
MRGRIIPNFTHRGSFLAGSDINNTYYSVSAGGYLTELQCACSLGHHDDLRETIQHYIKTRIRTPKYGKALRDFRGGIAENSLLTYVNKEGNIETAKEMLTLLWDYACRFPELAGDGPASALDTDLELRAKTLKTLEKRLEPLARQARVKNLTELLGANGLFRSKKHEETSGNETKQMAKIITNYTDGEVPTSAPIMQR